MAKARLSTEDLRRTNKLREQIKVWESLSRATETGSKGNVAIVASHDFKLAGGKEGISTVTLYGSLDHEVLLSRIRDGLDGDIRHRLGLIAGNHLRAMASEAVDYLKCQLPVEIVDDVEPVKPSPQPAPVNMTEQKVAAAI